MEIMKTMNFYGVNSDDIQSSVFEKVLETEADYDSEQLKQQTGENPGNSDFSHFEKNQFFC